LVHKLKKRRRTSARNPDGVYVELVGDDPLSPRLQRIRSIGLGDPQDAAEMHAPVQQAEAAGADCPE
jgi:hypothetical protein